MGRFIVKFGDYYCEWSTIVDAPVTTMMTEVELEQYVRDEYGRQGSENFRRRMARVKDHGISSLDPSVTMEGLLECNRAGANETCISTVEAMIEAYKKAQ